MEEKQKPVKEIRLGRIRAAVWANQGRDYSFWYSVTASRLYRDGEQWKDTQSFRRDDLPVVAKVLDMAYAWIWEQQPPAGSGQTNE